MLAFIDFFVEEALCIKSWVEKKRACLPQADPQGAAQAAPSRPATGLHKGCHGGQAILHLEG